MWKTGMSGSPGEASGRAFSNSNHDLNARIQQKTMKIKLLFTSTEGLGVGIGESL